MHSLWRELAMQGNVTWDAERDARASLYLDLLLEANERLNLTRITERANAEVLHVADALSVLPLLSPAAHELADVGSGGGVPGIPIAIARPDVRVTLVESLRKKATFLESAVARLRLTNVTVVAERAETLARARPRAFDVVTARAVAPLRELVATCWPLLAPAGHLLAMKGGRAAAELAAARAVLARLGAGEPRLHAVSLPGAERHVIVEITRQ